MLLQSWKTSCAYPHFRRTRLFAMLVCVVLLKAQAVAQNVVTMEGDALIGGLFGIQEGRDGNCNDYRSVSVQSHQAVRWMLNQLNQRNFIPNVTIGLKAYKTCGQSALAVRRSVDILKTSADNSSDEFVYAIFGPDKSSETKEVSRFLSSLPTEDRFLQISPTATAVFLDDRTIYKNLYRIMENDEVQVKVMLQLLLELKWNYVAIIYEGDTYSTEGATALKKLAETNGICVPVFQMLSSNSTTLSLRETLDIQSSPVSAMVVFSGPMMVKTILEYLNEHLKKPNFQLVVSEALALEVVYLKDGNNVVYDRARGLLTSTPVYSPVAEFTSYWNSLFENQTMFREEGEKNPWIVKYFESMTGCSFTPSTNFTDCWQKSSNTYNMIQQPLFISYAMLGAGILAQTLKNVHLKICGGNSGMCDSIKQAGKSPFIQELETLTMTPSDLIDSLFPSMTNITFEDGKLESDRGMELYQIYNFNKNKNNQFSFQKVGTFSGTFQLTQNEIRSYDKSGVEMGPVAGECETGFLCQECLPDPAQQILHISGDFYVIGLVPIHNKHPVSNESSSLFQYGELRESVSIDIAEAMIHAVHTINSKGGRYASVLGEKKIGLVLLDTSNNPLIVKDKIVSLHKGEVELGGGILTSQIVDSIIGYVGPLSSSISTSLSPTMKELNQLLIAYASTSVKLRDKTEHPTFMRTSESLDKQVKPMMKVARAIDATYIQLLYTDESYGQSGKDAVLTAASDEGICVAQAVPVGYSANPEDYRGTVNRLRQFKHAKLVIVFANSHAAPPLMKMINSEMNHGEFVFFGADEGWAKRLDVIEGNYNLKGGFTMAQDLPADQAFEQYFYRISATSSQNPWLKEYLEETADCYLPGSFAKKSSHSANPRRPCTSDHVSVTHKIHAWIPFAANAVHALVTGFNRTLANVCRGMLKKCAGYSTNELIKHTKEVMLDIYGDGKLRHVFNSEGDGAGGFRITHIVQSKGSRDLLYKHVGMAVGDHFSFNQSLLDTSVTYTSVCPSDSECEKCREPDKSLVYIPYLAIIGTEAVLMGILLTIIAILCENRTGRVSSQPSKRPVLSDE